MKQRVFIGQPHFVAAGWDRQGLEGVIGAQQRRGASIDFSHPTVIPALRHHQQGRAAGFRFKLAGGRRHLAGEDFRLRVRRCGNTFTRFDGKIDNIARSEFR